MCSGTHAPLGFEKFSFACMHVIQNLRRVRLVGRDGDDWTLDCGEGDHFGVADWGRLHTFHLLDADPTLRALAGLRPGAQALRLAVGSPWLRLEL